MIAEPLPPPAARVGLNAKPAWSELAFLITVLSALQAGGAALKMAWRYDRSALAHGQWWRLETAHWVHWGWDHWAMNVAGLAGLWWLYAPLASRLQWLCLTLGCGLGISLGLYAFSPEVSWYVGLSGVLHGYWAAAALMLWRVNRLEAVGAAALLMLKLAFEYLHGPVSVDPSPTLTVIIAAHRWGALSGALSALAVCARRIWL